MKLEFLGAAHEVTGSCHYLEFADKHVLVDCGMEQGPDLYVNQEIPVNASTIDYVFVTHAHIDHSGLLPMLYNHGFRGQIFTTTATHQLCEIMLKDSAHIQMFEAEWKNRKAKRAGKPEVVPLYDMNDAMGVLGHFVSCDYHSVINVCEGLKVRFVDAGHLLGSSSIEMWISENTGEGVEERKIVFSGDIGPGNRPLIKDPEYLTSADYVVMESTYGDRTHISFASLPDMWQYTITLNGFSKAFAMTGWRVGYACGPKEILSVMLKIHQYSILCAPRMGQVAALEALQAGRANDYEDVRRMRDSYDRRRRLMLSLIHI